MLKKNREKALLCTWLMCLFLCACGADYDDVILIGSQASENGAVDDTAKISAVLEKNRRENVEHMVQSVDASLESSGTIRVYVCGAVVSPGVVEIPGGSRVEVALAAAGGFARDANQSYVNLADWVTDGQMLYFPTEEEVSEGKVRTETAQSEETQVNINTADMELLCTLPGIGEGRAADIIAYREENGLFESCEDIMSVTGIKAGVYEKIRDKITVD